MGFGFDLMSSVFPFFFIGTFLMVMGVFAVTFFRMIKQWNSNNHSPRLTVKATVVSKRTNVSNHHSNGHHHHSTSYYATFQVESGDRMELQLQGHEYGLIVEEDRGELTFQGTRFLGFIRT